MRIFISAGEPSGDLHAANLIRSLRERLPDAQFVGFGGSKMTEAGASLLFPLVNLAVMWFLNVLLNLVTFVRLVFVADRYFRDERPDAVVLIDYPGLHWWIAGRAKARGIPVFYFVPPQIWAWAGWRVKKVRKYVDQVLCSLPFEPAWYHARGVEGAIYVGHPYFDELADRPLDEGFLAEQRAQPGDLVAILPGSRTQEVLRNLPDMLRAAKALSQARPGVRFAVACLHERHQAMAERILAESGTAGADIPVDIDLCGPHAGVDPIGASRLGRLGLRRARIDGRGSSVGRAVQGEAIRPLGRAPVHQVEIHQPGQSPGRRRGVPRVPDVEGRLGRARTMGRDLARRPGGLFTDDVGPGRLAVQVAQPGASDRAADRIIDWLHQHRGTTSAASYRGPHEIVTLPAPAGEAGSHGR